MVLVHLPALAALAGCCRDDGQRDEGQCRHPDSDLAVSLPSLCPNVGTDPHVPF